MALGAGRGDRRCVDVSAGPRDGGRQDGPRRGLARGRQPLPDLVFSGRASLLPAVGAGGWGGVADLGGGAAQRLEPLDRLRRAMVAGVVRSLFCGVTLCLGWVRIAARAANALTVAACWGCGAWGRSGVPAVGAIRGAFISRPYQSLDFTAGSGGDVLAHPGCRQRRNA